MFSSPELYSVDHIEKNEMGGACLTYGGEQRGIQVLVGKPEGKSHLEDPGVDGRSILRWILRKWNGGMDWMDLAQNRGIWQALVSAVMNLRVL